MLWSSSRRPSVARAYVGSGLCAALLCALGASQARADLVIQKHLEDRGAAWSLLELGSTENPEASYDPKRLTVGPDGAVYLLAKRPVQGPAAGVQVFRVEDDALAALGEEIPGDADALLADERGVYVGAKGTPTERRGQVWSWDGEIWKALSKDGVGAEIHALFHFQGALYFGTNNDGVYKVDADRFVRVGARREVQRGGLAWTRVGDWSADTERAVAAPNGDIVALGKDLRVRRFTKGAWQDLGNLAEAVLDATGALVSYAREPKAVALVGNEVYVGTKGGTGAPEGREVGAVFAWRSGAWERLGEGAGMKKEVKVLVPLSGGQLLAGTNESGFWHWDGTKWSQRNAGLPVNAGKLKSEVLELTDSGKLLAGVANTLYQSTNQGGAWTELGFLSGGEEIRAILEDASGTIHVGVKRGDGTGAVFDFDGKKFVQRGGDLTKEARGLVLASDGTLVAALGGNSGLYRFTDGAWKVAVGDLAGDAADFKQIFRVGAYLVGATKSGIQQGVLGQDVETWQGALMLREMRSLWSVGDTLFAGVKVGGIFRLGDGDGADGLAFERVDEGLPEVEVEGFQFQGATGVLALGKGLLYGAQQVRAGSPIKFMPLGTNPGAAKLDGDGKMVFTGETSFKSSLWVNDELWAGTADGLFASRDQGATWRLVNGPADIKAMELVGDKLYVAWKGELTPDPTGAPTVQQQIAGLAVYDLAAPAKDEGDSEADSPADDEDGEDASDSDSKGGPASAKKPSSGGCALGAAPNDASGGLGWLLAALALCACRRTKSAR